MRNIENFSEEFKLNPNTWGSITIPLMKAQQLGQDEREQITSELLFGNPLSQINAMNENANIGNQLYLSRGFIYGVKVAEEFFAEAFDILLSEEVILKIDLANQFLEYLSYCKTQMSSGSRRPLFSSYSYETREVINYNFYASEVASGNSSLQLDEKSPIVNDILRCAISFYACSLFCFVVNSNGASNSDSGMTSSIMNWITTSLRRDSSIRRPLRRSWNEINSALSDTRSTLNIKQGYSLREKLRAVCKSLVHQGGEVSASNLIGLSFFSAYMTQTKIVQSDQTIMNQFGGKEPPDFKDYVVPQFYRFYKWLSENFAVRSGIPTDLIFPVSLKWLFFTNESELKENMRQLRNQQLNDLRHIDDRRDSIGNPLAVARMLNASVSNIFYGGWSISGYLFNNFPPPVDVPLPMKRSLNYSQGFLD